MKLSCLKTILDSQTHHNHLNQQEAKMHFTKRNKQSSLVNSLNKQNLINRSENYHLCKERPPN